MNPLENLDQPHRQVPQPRRPEKLAPDPELLHNANIDIKAEPLEPPPRDYVKHDNAGGEGSHQAAATIKHGIYSPAICATPRSCRSPASSISGDSMSNHVDDVTPPESPAQADSPETTPAAQIGRLSLENEALDNQTQSRRGRAYSNVVQASTSKRSASSDLPRPPEKHQSGATNQRNVPYASTRNTRNYNRPNRARTPNLRQSASRAGVGQQPQTIIGRAPKNKFNNPNHNVGDVPSRYVPRDSGYGSLASRGNTLQQIPQQHGTAVINKTSAPVLSNLDESPSTQVAQQPERNLFQAQTKTRYPGIQSQPDSSPISQDQLAAEVKGIYAGLVMVEAKCINIDAAQAADPQSQLGPEQWQALIALHRTLLYEHHDFLMATQHPSATHALRGLATKYSMPARMWKHGIHAFLEVLRHRRPNSQDYMLAFIYLAYQMMALLFETVPTFTDTWIECLGDLARYRMAIEEEKEAHATWGGVAMRWYTMATDRHPNIGRLNHHLGILERPSLKKVFLYAKALTCCIQFHNARDSLATLCDPIIQDGHFMQSGAQSAEALTVMFHAQLFSASDSSATRKTASDALTRLNEEPHAKVKDIGVLLVVTNIASLFELGSPNNQLWSVFEKAVNDVIQSSRPSTIALGAPAAATLNEDQLLSLTGTCPASFVYDFTYASFIAVIRHGNDPDSIRNVLPSVHAVLVWLHSLYTLRSRVNDDLCNNTCDPLLAPNRFSWVGLCDFLNMLIRNGPMNERTMEYARQGDFFAPGRNEDARPLSEDFLIRGLIWTQFYFPSDWFEGQTLEDGRSIETDAMHEARTDRVLRLALYLAFRIEYIQYDVHTSTFLAPVPGSSHTVQSEEAKTVAAETVPSTEAPTPNSHSSSTFSTHSDSDGYAVVAVPKRKPIKTYAKVASEPRKARQDTTSVRVVDDDGMQWEP